MGLDSPPLHACPEMKRAGREGFILRSREAGGLRLADLVTRGPPSSNFQSRRYGPPIIFCPFCGVRLETGE